MALTEVVRKTDQQMQGPGKACGETPQRKSPRVELGLKDR